MSHEPRGTGSVDRDGTYAAADDRGTIFQEDIVTSPFARKVLAVNRLLIGWTFLWPFIDKVFGLNYGTPPERAWINGGTPAQGFLGGAVEDTTNPFSGLMNFFLSWGAFADIIFMLGLLGIGVAMMAGAGLKVAAWAGTALLFFMYLAEFPIGRGGMEGMQFTNPITDSHWLEAIQLWVAAYTLSGDTWGVGKWWGRIVGNGWLR